MSTALQQSQNIQTEISGAGSLHVQGPIGSDDWKTLAQIANIIGNTEFVPKGLRGNKPAIMACLLYGRDQGIPATIALTEINVIDGTPSMSAALQAAKAKANGHRISRVEHRDADGEVVAVTAKGIARDGTEDEVTWTLKDAERAGLIGKQNWKRYPRQMLWARAVSELCNTLFQDSFLGSAYTVDELDEGQSYDIDGDGGLEAQVAATTPSSAARGGEDQAATGSAAGHLPPVGADDSDGAAAEGGSAAPTVASSGDVEFTNGVHAGKTIAQVAAEDPNYLHAAKDFKTGKVGKAVKDYLAEHDEIQPVPAAPDLNQEELL